MTQMHSESSNSHTTIGLSQNNQNSHSSEQLVERERIPNTGFDIVGNKEKGYFIAFGPYRITEYTQDKAQLRKKVASKDYEIILGLLGACMTANEPELLTKIETLIHNIVDARFEEKEHEKMQQQVEKENKQYELQFKNQ